MGSEQCAKHEQSAAYSSREPVRTIDQNATSPLLGMGITITSRPLPSVFAVVGKGMMSVTEFASCASDCALGMKIAPTSNGIQMRRKAAARSAIRDDDLGM